MVIRVTTFKLKTINVTIKTKPMKARLYLGIIAFLSPGVISVHGRLSQASSQTVSQLALISLQREKELCRQMYMLGANMAQQFKKRPVKYLCRA